MRHETGIAVRDKIWHYLLPHRGDFPLMPALQQMLDQPFLISGDERDHGPSAATKPRAVTGHVTAHHGSLEPPHPGCGTGPDSHQQVTQ